MIASVRHTFIETRLTINKLDNTLSIIMLMSIISGMYAVMIQIYILIIYCKHEAIQEMSGILLSSSISNTIKLIGNCLIHGLVREESDQLLSCLDNISAKDEPVFKEALLFMSIGKDLKFGFTISGFMPLRKTTLTSVRFVLL